MTFGGLRVGFCFLNVNTQFSSPSCFLTKEACTQRRVVKKKQVLAQLRVSSISWGEVCSWHWKVQEGLPLFFTWAKVLQSKTSLTRAETENSQPARFQQARLWWLHNTENARQQVETELLDTSDQKIISHIYIEGWEGERGRGWPELFLPLQARAETWEKRQAILLHTSTHSKDKTILSNSFCSPLHILTFIISFDITTAPWGKKPMHKEVKWLS